MIMTSHTHEGVHLDHRDSDTPPGGGGDERQQRVTSATSTLVNNLIEEQVLRHTERTVRAHDRRAQR